MASIDNCGKVYEVCQKSVKDGKIDQKLIEHPGFNIFLQDIFGYFFDDDSYSVVAKNNFIEIRKNSKKFDEVAVKCNLELGCGGQNLIVKCIFGNMFGDYAACGLKIFGCVASYNNDGKEKNYIAYNYSCSGVGRNELECLSLDSAIDNDVLNKFSVYDTAPNPPFHFLPLYEKFKWNEKEKSVFLNVGITKHYIGNIDNNNGVKAAIKLNYSARTGDMELFDGVSEGFKHWLNNFYDIRKGFVVRVKRK